MKSYWGDVSKVFSEFFARVSQYWNIYGGWSAFFRSPFFVISIIFFCFTYSNWSVPGWWDDVLGVIPDIVGFSIGGYAIMLAFGDEGFRKALSGPGQEGAPSLYLQVNASFVHFIVIQILSLLTALIGKAWIGSVEQFGLFDIVLSAFGYWLFLYALLCVAAAAFAILSLSLWHDQHRGYESKDQDEES